MPDRVREALNACFAPLPQDRPSAGEVADLLAAHLVEERKHAVRLAPGGSSGELRLAIVLDEAQRLAKDATLPKLMKEGRKFGVAVVVASQGIDDFHPDVLANAGTKIIYRVSACTARQPCTADSRVPPDSTGLSDPSVRLTA